ncbi:MAG: hypothetical protein NC483_02980 [Ruminococcus sp.]|nr:hypothetical protein [Ruminococcus sp.]
MLEELITYLNTLKKEEKTVYDDNTKSFLAYFDVFLNTYPLTDISKLQYISYNELLRSFILSYCNSDFNSALSNLNKYSKYFKKQYRISVLMAFVYYFTDLDFKNWIDKLDYMPSFDLLEKLHLSCPKIKKKYNISTFIMVYVVTIFRKNPNIRQDLSFLSRIDFQDLMHFHKACWLLKYYKEDIANYQKPRNKKSDFLSLERLLSLIDTNYNQVIKEQAKSLSKVRKDNRKIDELIDKLRKEGEITNIDYILKLCPNNEAREKVASYVLMHNNEIYEELLNKQISLDNDIDILTRLFKAFGYDFSSLEKNIQNRFINVSYDNINEILLWLKKNNIYLGIKELSFINITKIHLIEEMLNKGLLEISFIRSNSNILYDELTLNKINDNIKILNSFNINVINYHNSLDILLSDNVLANLQLLASYGLNITRETTKILFLKDDNLDSKIELIIEMGYISLNSLDILNRSLEELYKIKIAKLLDLPINSINDINFNEYYIAYSDFFTSKEPENQVNVDLPKFLKKYAISNNILLINGIYISKIKLLNNLNGQDITFVSIFYAIIKGSFYTFYEIDALREELIPEFKDLYTLIRKKS